MLHLLKKLNYLLPKTIHNLVKALAHVLLICSLCGCGSNAFEETVDPIHDIASTESTYDVIFDTDANNELDDQHALAYLLLNQGVFNIKGITVNATYNGGDISEHYQEAKRVISLCVDSLEFPLIHGANGNFEEIAPFVHQDNFDGNAAVTFIVSQAKRYSSRKLVLIPVGKLTNVALALKRDPSIANNIRIVWLGSNYPQPGEYNQDNDIPSMNYILNTNAPFEMVTVRYGDPSGTAAVTVSQDFINENMPGLGRKAAQSVTGRHGGTYDNFGDYSVSLFEHIDYHGAGRERALFDLAAVAIIKNPNWANARLHPCPIFEDGQWTERPSNQRKIVIWENFQRDSIIEDFMAGLEAVSN